MLRVLQIAAVKEVLRISAVVTSRLPITAEEELRDNDWVTPRKTPVGMTPHDVLLDPGVFSAPQRFDPYRWIGNPHLAGTLYNSEKGQERAKA
ncbi:MAG: hypothetical protein Q9208_003273 [Pyrenodesmia sp. 3 TL-2023]